MKLKLFFLQLLIICLSFQLSYWGLSPSVYSILRIINIILILILFSLSLKDILNIFYKSSLYNIVFYFIALNISITLILNGLKTVEYNLVLEVVMVFIIILISLTFNLNERELVNLCLLFLILTAFSSLSIVYYYAPGFVINEQYLPVPKNQLAPIYSISSIVGIYLFFKSNSKLKYVYMLFSLILLLSILTIRGRAVIVSYALSLILMLVFFIKSNKIRLYVSLAFILLTILFYDKIYDSLFLNYDTTNLDSISTGRFSTYEESLILITEYPFFGEIGYNKINTYTTHNYLLNVLIKYGLIGGLVLIGIYFLILRKVCIAIFRNNFKIYEIGLLPIFILFVVSFFEYSFPYSPGSSTFFAFFLFGQYLKNNDTSR
ncbi:hypothetical protein OBK28_11765 [Empedobacter falsenii]